VLANARLGGRVIKCISAFAMSPHTPHHRASRREYHCDGPGGETELILNRRLKNAGTQSTCTWNNRQLCWQLCCHSCVNHQACFAGTNTLKHNRRYPYMLLALFYLFNSMLTTNKRYDALRTAHKAKTSRF